MWMWNVLDVRFVSSFMCRFKAECETVRHFELEIEWREKTENLFLDHNWIQIIPYWHSFSLLETKVLEALSVIDCFCSEFFCIKSWRWILWWQLEFLRLFLSLCQVQRSQILDSFEFIFVYLSWFNKVQ